MPNIFRVDADGPTLVRTPDGITVHHSMPLSQAWLVYLMALIAAPVVLAGAAAALGLFWVFATSQNLLALLVAIGFVVGFVPAAWGFLTLQGMAFPFRVALTSSRYILTNGIRRRTRSIDPNQLRVLILPCTMGGDWGLCARVQYQDRRLTWPFVPTIIIGSRRKAFRRAESLRDWLSGHEAISEVVLAKWGPSRE